MLQVRKNYSGPGCYGGTTLGSPLVRKLGFSPITHGPSCSFYYITHTLSVLLLVESSQLYKPYMPLDSYGVCDILRVFKYSTASLVSPITYTCISRRYGKTSSTCSFWCCCQLISRTIPSSTVQTFNSCTSQTDVSQFLVVQSPMDDVSQYKRSTSMTHCNLRIKPTFIREI